MAGFCRDTITVYYGVLREPLKSQLPTSKKKKVPPYHPLFPLPPTTIRSTIMTILVIIIDDSPSHSSLITKESSKQML